jgi:hypothetical protein
MLCCCYNFKNKPPIRSAASRGHLFAGLLVRKSGEQAAQGVRDIGRSSADGGSLGIRTYWYPSKIITTPPAIVVHMNASLAMFRPF